MDSARPVVCQACSTTTATISQAPDPFYGWSSLASVDLHMQNRVSILARLGVHDDGFVRVGRCTGQDFRHEGVAGDGTRDDLRRLAVAKGPSEAVARQDN